MYCISISGLSFAVHMSVLSAYCVFILLHCVSLCSVVFLYSLSATFCLPVLTSGPFFQCEALFLHMYLRRWPHFVEVLSSCCIKALSLFFILRLRPHILFWGFGLVLYWGFVLTCSYINFNLRFCWPPCFDMCEHYSPAFIVMGHCNTLLYALLSMSHQCF